jgi:hypothetical protein
MTNEHAMGGEAAALTDLELEAIRARWTMTTPGPWKSFVESREKISGSSFIMTGGEDLYLSGATEDDQDFIASAHQDIPRLLAEIERLKTKT